MVLGLYCEVESLEVGLDVVEMGGMFGKAEEAVEEYVDWGLFCVPVY